MTGRRYRILLLLTFAGAVLAGCGGDGGAAGDGRVLPRDGGDDGLTVTFASEPDPPAKGENAFELTVRGADGSPVTDATVTTVFSMPAMPAMNMPAMRSEATLRHEGDGRYRGTGELEMGGTWNVTVTLARGAEELGRRRFTLIAKE